MGWIEDVLDSTAEAETPRSFIKWAAIATISAVLRDSVYLDKHYYKLYPNLFIMLVAKSGLRKGLSANIAQVLTTLVDNTRVISGRNSIQAIVKELSTAVTRPKKPPLMKAHGFIVSGELSTTFVEDPHTLPILMDLYDGHYHKVAGWKNTLKGSGVETLKDLCISMLGAINQDMLQGILTRRDVRGGFIARVIIVEEYKRALRNPLVKAPKVKFEIEKLLPRLKEISELTGEFKWCEEAGKYFEDWYMQWNPEEMEDETGTANRVHDQILKLAMILSVSRDNDLIILKQDIVDAMDLLNPAIKTAEKVTKGTSGKSEFGPKIKIVLEELINHPEKKVWRSYLLRKYWGEFTAPELDVIINTLHQAKSIMIIKAKGGKDELYKATPRLIEAYEAFKGGIH